MFPEWAGLGVSSYCELYCLTEIAAPKDAILTWENPPLQKNGYLPIEPITEGGLITRPYGIQPSFAE